MSRTAGRPPWQLRDDRTSFGAQGECHDPSASVLVPVSAPVSVPALGVPRRPSPPRRPVRRRTVRRARPAGHGRRPRLPGIRRTRRPDRAHHLGRAPRPRSSGCLEGSSAEAGGWPRPGRSPICRSRDRGHGRPGRRPARATRGGATVRVPDRARTVRTVAPVRCATSSVRYAVHPPTRRSRSLPSGPPPHDPRGTRPPARGGTSPVGEAARPNRAVPRGRQPVARLGDVDDPDGPGAARARRPVGCST